MLYKNVILFLVIIMKIYLKNWMSNINGNTNLFSLDIPGTHDCVTQYIQLAHHFRCQDKNIYEQLCLGVRALDIRVEAHGDRLKMVHGISKAFCTPNKLGKQMDMSDVLEQCYRFLDENPTESIIFQFKNDMNNANEKCFNNLYYTYINNNREKWYLKNKIPTVVEARGKIVLIRRCKMYMSTPEFTDDTTGIDFSRFVEQTTAVPEPLVLDTKSLDGAKFIIQDRFKYKPVPRWNECVKPFLDSRGKFDGSYIFCYLSTAGGMKGPKHNAEYINKMFLDYPLKKDAYYGTIFVDFPTAALTKKIISNNFDNKC